ncbi:hypothetical protein [Nitrosospira sp. Nl5]|uniref:hypothetical protein n=1 Tax=Nitrosospira sp. Nl5 TaxID=200120 RepID=UPI00115F84C5|nr:hypothetical protein [Nitrosospira sp. Nl5]
MSSGSADAVPSAKYIGYWPMSMWLSPTTWDFLTQVGTAAIDTTNNWITGFTSSAWAVAGTPVKVRATATFPAGLSSTIVYYAGKPTADRLTLHLTEAAALAGTGIVDITSQGTGDVTIYPAFVKDWSGQGNDLLYGDIFDTQVFATFPYMSTISSGSVDGSVGRLPVAALSAQFVWPTDTFLCFFRAKFGTLVAGRSFFGNGVSGASHGPRFNIGSADTSKLNLQVAHAGTVISATSAAEACSITTEHHIALALEGPTGRATVWIDGERDLNIGSLSLSTVAALNFTTDLRLGGVNSTNSHAAGFCDYHVLAWTGSLPSNIDTLMRRIAATRYHRLSASDL